jgi:hypothetical protein
MPKASCHLTLALGAALGVNRGSASSSSSRWSDERHLAGTSLEPFFSNQASNSHSFGRAGNSCLPFDITPFGRFWVKSDVLSEDDEGKEIATPTKEEFIEAAPHAGYDAQDLIQAENEIVDMEKVSFSSPASSYFCCPISSKIIKAIARGKSLKHNRKPWQGSLPKPRISPPRTLGDAVVVKNSYIRLRGGQLQLKSFKMSLPSTIYGTREVSSPAARGDQVEDWPPLLALAASQERKATLAPDPVPIFQNPNPERQKQEQAES